MRTPTPLAELYAWHTAALAGKKPVITDEPQAGWYKRVLVKGGVMVPARIWVYQNVDRETGELVEDELLQCEVNGQYADAQDQWSWLASNPISRAEFNYLMARIEHAVRHEPDDAFADPRRPVDLNSLPLPF